MVKGTAMEKNFYVKCLLKRDYAMLNQEEKLVLKNYLYNTDGTFNEEALIMKLRWL
jgi:hypothetical protein